MTSLRARFGELPAALRWALLGAAGILVATIVVSAAWSWSERRETAAARAFAAVQAAAQPALASGQAGDLESAAKKLNQFLSEHPRSRVVAQAWYTLGDVEFHRQRWDAAAAAFAEAARRDTGSVGALSRLGEGYAYEAKGDPARALQAYQPALAGRGPADFLYGELLLAKARVQELAKDSAGAVATYKQYLKDLPSGDRAEEVRIRLALLGSSG